MCLGGRIALCCRFCFLFILVCFVLIFFWGGVVVVAIFKFLWINAKCFISKWTRECILLTRMFDFSNSAIVHFVEWNAEIQINKSMSMVWLFHSCNLKQLTSQNSSQKSTAMCFYVHSCFEASYDIMSMYHFGFYTESPLKRKI